jgi:hypothetical protein
MAVYGIGAFYESQGDVSNHFINQNCACVGWDESTAPSLHAMLRKIKNGDWIYIKSFQPKAGGSTLSIKAIGVVINDEYQSFGTLGYGVGVKWIWQWTGKEKINLPKDKNNVYSNTLYEEYNKEIQQKIISLALS